MQRCYTKLVLKRTFHSTPPYSIPFRLTSLHSTSSIPVHSIFIPSLSSSFNFIPLQSTFIHSIDRNIHVDHHKLRSPPIMFEELMLLEIGVGVGFANTDPASPSASRAFAKKFAFYLFFW